MTKKGLLFIVSAPSGAGKTSLIKAVLSRLKNKNERELRWSCSYTTRSPRPGEKNGVDYFFVSEEEFSKMVENGEFAEWAWVHGHRYGTSKDYLERAQREGIDLLLEIDTQGARQLRERYQKGVFIFILPPSRSVLEQRLKGRATESPATIEKRLQKAKEEVEEYPLYDYIIINDNFEDAVLKLESILRGERQRKELLEERVKEIVKDFLGGE